MLPLYFSANPRYIKFVCFKYIIMNFQTSHVTLRVDQLSTVGDHCSLTI